MRVLLTGATGFLGRKIVPALLTRGLEVRCLVHTPGKEEVLGDAPVDVCYGDVADVAALKASMYHVDAVIHLAGVVREQHGRGFQEVNVLGARNMAAVSRERGVEHLVYVSVVGALNNPRYPYLYSKWLAEQEVVQSGLPYTIIRPSLLFGEGDEFTNALTALLLISPLLPLPGLGRRRLQPMAVEDAARCIADTVGDERLMERTVELGGQETLTCKEIVDLVCSARGLVRLKFPFPLAILRRALWATEALHLHLPVTGYQLDLLAFDHVCEGDSVEKLFGFQPKRLADGIPHVRAMSHRDAWRLFLGIPSGHVGGH